MSYIIWVPSVSAMWLMGKHRPRSCSRKHFKAESNLLDMLRRSLHSFHRALKNVLPLLLHCPAGKLTCLLVLSPYTQGMVNVLNKHDTYADILELLWEYLPLMSLPLMTLLVSEKRSDSWPWGASSSRGEEPESMKTTCKWGFTFSGVRELQLTRSNLRTWKLVQSRSQNEIDNIYSFITVN